MWDPPAGNPPMMQSKTLTTPGKEGEYRDVSFLRYIYTQGSEEKENKIEHENGNWLELDIGRLWNNTWTRKNIRTENRAVFFYALGSEEQGKQLHNKAGK